jgi:phage repressor protein C with HTH and peptisase S24 domain
MKLLEAVQTAQFLGVSQEEVLRHAGDTDAPQPEPRGRGRPPRSAVSQPPLPHQDTIPIRSVGHGVDDQLPTFHEGPVGYTARPANLTGVRDAYAIYMTGDAMEPRYMQGWLLHVHPSKPPTRGRDVVVTKSDSTVMVRQYVGWDHDTLVLLLLHPEQMLRIQRQEVVACHLIVGVDQEG